MPISNNTTSISGHPIGVSHQTTGILPIRSVSLQTLPQENS